jgi:hypothetical protein
MKFDPWSQTSMNLDSWSKIAVKAQLGVTR